MNGSKYITEAVDLTFVRWEESAVHQIQAIPEGVVAGCTGDYAGMSNDKAGENPARRKPKVSWGR